MAQIDIVIPFYNEELVIRKFFNSLVNAIKDLPHTFQIIAVNDGSTDQTERVLHEVLTQIEQNHPSIMCKQVNFIKNYGHQPALISGLLKSSGDCVITMDGDLQHPPELIETMIQFWENGNEIVQTVRLSTEGVSLFKQKTSDFFYWLMRMLTQIDIARGGSDFRLISKMANNHLVQIFNRWSSRDFLLRIVIPNFGFKTDYLQFHAPARFAGASNFSTSKMLRLFLAAIISYTRFPIYVALFSLLIYFVITLIGVILFTSMVEVSLNLKVVLWLFWFASLFGIALLSMCLAFAYKVYREIAYQPVFVDKS